MEEKIKKQKCYVIYKSDYDDMDILAVVVHREGLNLDEKINNLIAEKYNGFSIYNKDSDEFGELVYTYGDGIYRIYICVEEVDMI
nr:MAG TPA: hypothetical protein [Caudoviricetes sp.]